MRRCRQCKQYLIPKDAPKHQWWCSERCKQLKLLADYHVSMNKKMAKNMKEKIYAKAKPKKKKLKSIARLVDDCAVLLQRLVRLKAADSQGYVTCVTSGKRLHWSEAQGGHFIERGKKSTKLMVENCHPQSAGENMYRMKTASGVLDYRRYMVSMYGEELVRDLEQLSKQPKKYTRQEVEELGAEFKRQIKEQEARLGI